MTFVSITRLRIRSLRFLLPFSINTLRTTKQVKGAHGFLGGMLLVDRRLTFWTATLWQEQANARRYMTSGSHSKAMPKLLDWCDEASVVHWFQEDLAAPDWHEIDHRMRTEGRPSKVRHPSPDHDDLTFKKPRTTRAVPLRPVAIA
jgi:hypothetical protein